MSVAFHHICGAKPPSTDHFGLFNATVLADAVCVFEDGKIIESFFVLWKLCVLHGSEMVFWGNGHWYKDILIKPVFPMEAEKDLGNMSGLTGTIFLPQPDLGVTVNDPD